MKDLVHEGVGKYVFPIYYAAVALIVVAAAFDWVPLDSMLPSLWCSPVRCWRTIWFG